MYCPAGKRAIGSGARILGVYGDVVIDEVYPSAESVVPGSVHVEAFEARETSFIWAVKAFAVCANVS